MTRLTKTFGKLPIFVVGILLFAMPKAATAQCGTAPQTGNITWTTATVTVTTTANTQHGGKANGTAPGTYTVTVNGFTESSSDATKPSGSGSFSLTVN